MTHRAPTVSVHILGEREMVMRRDFRAPRAFVFDAWAKPDLIVRWMAPAGWSFSVCEVDLRPGGGYRWVMARSSGGEIVMAGEYRVVERPDRLISTQRFEGFTEVGWRPEDEAVGTMILTERAGITTWTLTNLYPSREVRDAAFNDPNARSGLEEGFLKLEQMAAG